MNDGSPALSVILPVHGVQGYLQQCLDSILLPGCDYLELIAVNDCSPDSCGDILDEYSQRDTRVRVLHLEQNVGLGAARNIGLRHATGEYVWFFDSDDYAADGAVQAIYERLVATKPDVLIFDYARGYWYGRVRRSVINHLFREPPAPDVFTLAERPSVMRLMMTAWNKAIRREFLLDLDLTFSDGYYEDLNVTYPILMAAERLSLLDRMCYVYRQRRSGAITRTASERHFDVFAQYERVFAFMDSRGPAMDQFRPVMFDRMIWHLLVILRAGDRVPRTARKRYFAELSRLYHQFAPPGHHRPGSRGLALRYALIERSSHRTFELLRQAGRVLGWARAGAGRAKQWAGGPASVAKRRLRGLYYRVQLRLPMDERLAVYAAYWFRGYSCNPAAIYEKAKELAPHVRGVWVVRRGAEDTIPPGVDYVIASSRAYLRVMARAKYFVNNVNFPDHIVKRRGSVHVETQHGTPLKKMGLDQIDFPVGAAEMDFEALIARSDRWDFLISSNPLSSQAWARSFPCAYEMLEIGYPRNDRLVRATDDERRRLRAELGIPEGRTAILYTPTHRDYRRDYRPMFDLRRFTAELGPDYVVLLRTHYFYEQGDDWATDAVIDVSGHPSVEDLCIASDALLTDYSSIMFDYANLDRPIVVHAADWETYKLTRGVNFDITAYPPGVVAFTEDELIDAFVTRAAWSDQAAKVRAEFRARFCPWDDGDAAERAVRRIFLSA